MNAQKIPRGWLWACAGLVLAGLGLQLYQYSGTISNYPFTTYWSESNRIFSASLVYSLKIYGQQFAWPWLDPGRAILDGLVLLIPGTQIWMFRFWLAFLTLASSTLASVLVINRVRKIAGEKIGKYKLFSAIIIGWGILFFLQGPIYYHVLLGVLPVLWLFDLRKPVRTLVVVLAASAWEGLCRVNWFAMPAAIALLLYLLEAPVGGRRIGAYLKWPVVWGVAGVGASSLVYWLFIQSTHYPVVFFNPQMRYAFFSSRLWPNSAFILGLLPGIALVSLPLLVLVAPVLRKELRGLHWLRVILILGILAVFFLGSTYVSRRAGGGYDLHNYDTFMLLAFITCVYLGLGGGIFEQQEPTPLVNQPHPALALAILVIVPLAFTIRSLHVPAPELSRGDTSTLLAQLRDVVGNVGPGQGPVLFIDQRQLLVYGLVPGVGVYQPYDKIELMEMAMANNHAYRDAFRTQIEHHTFPVIVSEVHADAYQDANAPYGYENNVWFDDVSYPILHNYRAILLNKAAGIGVYVP